MIIRVQEDPRYGVVARVGAFTTEYGVRGSELERLIRRMTERFIRAMEARGYRLVNFPGNPAVVTNPDGSPMASYALDWEASTAELERVREGASPNDEEQGPVPRKMPSSLEESKGMVEYRIVGVFWAPERKIEIVTTLDAIREAERKARNPVQFLVERSV